MQDDWRLKLIMGSEEEADELLARLRALEKEDRGRVVVSRDGASIFLYADSERRAREVETTVRSLLPGGGEEARLSLTRWHPIEQEWEDASVPLPRTEEEREAEHARRQECEAEESRATGDAMWEVRIELASHGDTVDLANRLEAEGVPVVRRYTYLLVGAVNEDEAHALAERLAADAPPGARVEVEPGGRLAWEVAPRNPFVIFGGFGV